MYLNDVIDTAIAATINVKEITNFENGITSFNFPRRQDLLNARATRTTHPKAMALLQDLFAAITEAPLIIATPFVWKTKADVVEALANANGSALVPSGVSCSRTVLSSCSASHWGECWQHIYRRLAGYGRLV